MPFKNPYKAVIARDFFLGLDKVPRIPFLAPMGVASFLVLNLFQDSETSSGLERYNVQRE
ncbi:hypothetical protein [Flavobacterium sp. LB1P62]|uniref:hypothetical protein n=1 Tax=unclassified Flavobacterium TaxID=196869 RepID=UPI003AACD11F